MILEKDGQKCELLAALDAKYAGIEQQKELTRELKKDQNQLNTAVEEIQRNDRHGIMIIEGTLKDNKISVFKNISITI